MLFSGEQTHGPGKEVIKCGEQPHRSGKSYAKVESDYVVREKCY
jgi:hypothetical protein